MDELTAAIHEVSDEYGNKRMAADLGCSHMTWLNQINPANDRPPSLRKFYQMVRITQDARLLRPLLDEIGMVATPLPQGTSDAEIELRELLLDVVETVGKLTHEVREAKADGVIDGGELKEIREIRTEVAEKLNTVMHRLERKHQSGLRLAQ